MGGVGKAGTKADLVGAGVRGRGSRRKSSSASGSRISAAVRPRVPGGGVLGAGVELREQPVERDRRREVVRSATVDVLDRALVLGAGLRALVLGAGDARLLLGALVTHGGEHGVMRERAALAAAAVETGRSVASRVLHRAPHVALAAESLRLAAHRTWGVGIGGLHAGTKLREHRNPT
jgi:hypothetical protein